MCGCSRRATVCASRMNRSATTGDGASSTSSTFTATSRFKTLSRARNTAAKPPSPSRGPTVNSCPSACCRRFWRAPRSMAVQKARIAGRVLLGTSALFVVWLFAVWPPPVWWRSHEPRCTAMMRLRSVFRKLKEAVTAVRLELALSKDRIMALYLNTAEWGPGVWGASAASVAYFGVAPSRLSDAQAAALAATLPQPRTSNPAYLPGRMLARRDLILARYYGGKTPVPPAEEDSIPQIAPIEPPILPPILDTLVHPDTTKDHPDSGGPI